MSDKAAKITYILCAILGPLNIMVQWIANENDALTCVIAVLGGLCLFATGILGLKSLKDRRKGRERK